MEQCNPSTHCFPYVCIRQRALAASASASTSASATAATVVSGTAPFTASVRSACIIGHTPIPGLTYVPEWKSKYAASSAAAGLPKPVLPSDHFGVHVVIAFNANNLKVHLLGCKCVRAAIASLCSYCLRQHARIAVLRMNGMAWTREVMRTCITLAWHIEFGSMMCIFVFIK